MKAKTKTSARKSVLPGSGVARARQSPGRKAAATNVDPDLAPAQLAVSAPLEDNPAPSAGAAVVLTSIEAVIDVGPDNKLFVRGEGEGLSWDRGLPLQRVTPSSWTWSTRKADVKIVFKLLINDHVWSQGDNCVVRAGERLLVAPRF